MVRPIAPPRTSRDCLMLVGPAQQQADTRQTQLAGRHPTGFASLDQLGADAVDKPPLALRQVRADDVYVVEPGDL